MSESNMDTAQTSEIRGFLRTVSDKSLPEETRDCAKNDLMLVVVQRFKAKIFRLTGGSVGLADSASELQDSAFLYLRSRATKVAQEVEIQELPLAHVVSKWLNSWAVDKIRRADGNSLKRGKGKQRHAVDDFAEAAVSSEKPDEIVIQQETTAQIRLALSQALARLDDIERAVTLSYVDGDNESAITMREVADELGITLREANNARRRANVKLREWLEEFDPNNPVD